MSMDLANSAIVSLAEHSPQVLRICPYICVTSNALRGAFEVHTYRCRKPVCKLVVISLSYIQSD
jgi:hypothetical protein